MIFRSLLLVSALALSVSAHASPQAHAAKPAPAQPAGSGADRATAGGDQAAAVPEARPGSGDPAIDHLLADIDAYAARHRDAFVDELVRYFDAPRPLVTDLLAGDRRWRAGDVYYACALARVAGRPCRALLDAWAADSTQGWGPIAARMGVAKGSPQARRLREGIDQSYARWARPLPAQPARPANASP